MTNKQSHEFWELNDGANLKKPKLKLLKGLSNASGLNLIENLRFIKFIQFSSDLSNFLQLKPILSTGEDFLNFIQRICQP